MLDLNFIIENPDKVKEAVKNKNLTADVDLILEKVEEWKKISLEVQKLREERNVVAKQVQNAINGKKAEIIDHGKRIKQELEEKEKILRKLHDEDLHPLLISLPNPPKDDVKVGKDESMNEVIRKYKEPTKFDFEPKDHLTLGEALDLIDVERAAKVSGTRFAYLKGDAVLLEFALVQFALETLVKEGFIPVVPPVLIKKEMTEGLGYWQAGGNEDYYYLHEPEDNIDFYLVGTAEHAIVPMHKDETFAKKDLPHRYVGFSSAFRREAGTYGKDTKGILRVHQFDKVEMVSFTEKGKDDEEHEYLLSLEEKFFQSLAIPYQVIKMCSGDLGFPAARKYDIEAWMPGQQRYREVTSVSTVTDFQSRRLKIRYRDGEKTEFVSILNGTAFAIGRTIIAIMENYQQKDGSIVIPKVLRKYMGKDKITSQK